MSGRSKVSALLIAGPTASGKSALAITLAKHADGVVINADSMQVYADLRVLTARPTDEEMQRAPHRLFGHTDGATNYSVGRWLEDAAATLAETRAAGRLPIFVGGTGLYFKALTQGLSDIPQVPAEIRAETRAQGAALAPPELHARLTQIDPVMAARLKPMDSQRILRALEVFAATGRSLADFQGARSPPLLASADCIGARFDAMLAQGALDEVRALAARDLDPALPAMRAHGVPGLIAWLRGASTREAATAKGKIDTRHYAKRQFTFARHQLPDFQWLAPEDALTHLQARLRTIANMAPCGSSACTIQSPPGTSMGPCRIVAPSSLARSAAASIFGTLK
jgi:tRNA dimethylallyltransferase